MGTGKGLATLALFATFIERTMGLLYSAERLPELRQKMTSLSRQAGYPDLDQYLLFLMSAPRTQQQLEALALNLTIGETYFLRDPRSYQVLEEELLPGLIAARRATQKSLRIWSAGCASGEEPYSLAILLSRVIPDLSNWQITLIASDINPLALERGRQGVYSQWSFRDAPDWLMDYFSKQKDGRFQIIPRIRDMVQFRHLNLADEEMLRNHGELHGMDIIFCRNVMLYFGPEQADKTMALFGTAIKYSGWLFLGPTDVDHQRLEGYSCRHYQGAFVLSKLSTHPAESWAPESAAHQHSLSGAAPVPGADARHPGASSPMADRAGAPPEMRTPAAAAPPPWEEAPGAAAYAEALALYQGGRYQQAADRALDSLEAGALEADALALGARALANIGRLQEARECCERSISFDKLRPGEHYLLSIILEQLGDLQGAVTSLNHALYLDQDYLLAYFALGNLKRRCGEPWESERHFANALRLLEQRDPHEVLPEAEGLTAGRLAEIIRSLSKKGATADFLGC